MTRTLQNPQQRRSQTHPPSHRYSIATLARRRRNAIYRTVADFTYDWELWISPGGQVRYASPSGQRITGYPQEAVRTDPHFFARLLHPEDWSHWYSAMAQSRLQNIGSMDFRIRRADGREIWLAQETTRVLDPRGTFRGLRLSLRDVTDRIRDRQALNQSKAELELRVRERTAELERSYERYRALSTYLQDSTEKERTRISREIHDILGQDLTALNMGLHRLEKTCLISPAQCAQQITELRALLGGTLETVRRISRELRPPILDELGFAAAVAWKVRSFEETTGIAVGVRIEGTPVLAPEQSTALYRILQETLTNVARHARATSVWVDIEARAELSMRIQDNGRGITPAELHAGDSLGIIGMRERIRSCGGEMHIAAAPEGGTTVSVRLKQDN